MNETHAPTQAQRYNAGLEHPAIAVAMRHLLRRNAAFEPTTFVELLSALRTFPDISVGSLVQAARLAGAELEGVGLDFDELPTVELPILAYLKQTPAPDSKIDLIQIERLGRTHVVVSSDRFGTARVSRADLELRWSGIALLAPRRSEPNGTSEANELARYRGQVSVIPGMVSPEECRTLIEYCEAAVFRRSRVGQRRGASRADVVSASVRSSSSVVLRDRNHPILRRLYVECAAREGVTPESVEQIQCVRYKKGQRFKAHFDGGVDLPRSTTYLLYLNDDFVGGETYFPLLDLAVAPVAGSCLRFPSCDDDGRVLWQSEHGGLPVSNGVKYALNVWVRCREHRGKHPALGLGDIGDAAAA